MPQAVSPNVNPAASAVTFDSFFMGGFECSSHRRKDGVRLDLVRATGHDSHAERDYRGCANLGLRTVRDGLRWHLIEKAPGVYDWSSWAPMIEAANLAGVQVIW
ncbi:MAG: beta-glucosidase, partial [Mesorhizobium sp.]